MSFKFYIKMLIYQEVRQQTERQKCILRYIKLYYIIILGIGVQII